jgi:hypothetical protein
MRYLLGLLAVILLPAVAAAQDVKRAPLADYVSFCLALWDGDSGLYAKATALGLQDVAGANPGVSITVEKSTLRFFKGVQGSGTVGSIYTTMEDGREQSCDINLTSVSERSDIEVMTRTLDLDGQILTLGSTTMGYWKIRKRQPVVLLRAILGKTNTMMTLVQFEPTLEIAKKSIAGARGATNSGR